MDDYDEEPTTKLSSAFVVVLILHVVAVGGIYAFNSIKASRRNLEQIQATVAPAAAETEKVGGATEADRTSANVSTPAASLALTHPAAAAHPVAAAAHPIESATPAANPAATAKPATPKQYVVKAGDSASKIAFAYRITPAELLAANNLKENALVHQGQTLTIPEPKSDAKSKSDPLKPTSTATASKTDVPPTKTTPGLYTIKKGDTAHSIAKSFGITVDELLKLNKITDPTKLQIGKQLKLPPHKS